MNKKYNICIVTYETLPNPITQNLKTFLLNNYNTELLYISHPMLDIKESYKKNSQYLYFKNNKIAKTETSFNWKFPVPLLYMKDVIYTLYWCLKFGKRWDAYFAAGNLNPLVGIVLRELGLVKKVIYQSLDYYPTRFENKFLNWVYFQFDKFFVRFSDETWNVSPIMVEAREKKMGMDRHIYNRQYTVPGGVWFYKAKRRDFKDIDKKKIVYRGYLIDYMGVDLIISAMPRIIKAIPGVHLEILGGGDQESFLKNMVKKLKIGKYVKFYGFIRDRKRLEGLLSDGALGIATFNTDILDDKVKNADPGKIKDYMLFGLPVITTDAVYYHQEITKKRIGIIVDYKPEVLAHAVIKLLKDEKLLREYRENALKFIEKFDCNKILKPNIERILNEI